VAAGAFTVTSEIRIEASPEAVFPFLTDPQKIVRWKGIDARVEASPGGVYRVNVTGTKHAVGSTWRSTRLAESCSRGDGRGTSSCRPDPRR
jgi:uncharacterized protein YndB with AHSA1/START domain